MKIISKFKEQNGSITIFVLSSMLFFTIVVMGLYMSYSYRNQAQQREIEKIQQSYKKEDIDTVYNEYAN
jgi:heme/copper-type cytochrome/quinol oxidase subunit 2